jgi:secondary thiamine-phosphate synthase enzyme
MSGLQVKKMFRNVFELKTEDKTEIIDITGQIKYIVGKSNTTSGIVNVYSRHSTSGVVINENEPGLIEDFIQAIETLVPTDSSYNHNRIDNNADSHLRSFFIGNSVTIPLSNADLDLGTWQSIFFVELDGPRTRKVTVTVIGK